MSSYSIRDVSIVNQLEALEKQMQFMKSTQFVGRSTLATKLSTSSRSPAKSYYNQDGSYAMDIARTVVHFKADSQLDPWGHMIINTYDLNGNKYSDTGNTDPKIPRLQNMYFVVTDLHDGTLRWNLEVRAESKFLIDFTVAATDSGAIIYEIQ